MLSGTPHIGSKAENRAVRIFYLSLLARTLVGISKESLLGKVAENLPNGRVTSVVSVFCWVLTSA